MTRKTDPFAILLEAPPYRPLFLFDLPLGLVAGARYATSAVPSWALKELHPSDRGFAEAFPIHQAAEFVAGRLALCAALKGLRYPPSEIGALPQSPRGAPVPPRGFVASVSHKAGIALALAGVDHGHGVGVDIESLVPERTGLASRILGDDEVIDLSGVAARDTWTEVLARFSIKEAAYKAMSEYIGDTPIGFRQVVVRLPKGLRQSDGFQIADVVVEPGILAVPLDIQALVAVFGTHLVAASAVQTVKAN